MPEKALCTKMEQKLELEEKRQIMNFKREKTKRNICFLSAQFNIKWPIRAEKYD